jgi:hypothetical protein
VALALYLFDRVVTLIGNVLPPRLFWRGDLLLHLGEQRLTHLWFTCPKIADVSGLSREVNRLVERAFAENRSRLTSGLEWPQKKFSDAARTVNYCKVLVYWIVACAIYALAYLPHKNETARRLFVLMGSGLLAYVGAVLLETHRLFDVDQERLRIAETMIEIEGGQYEYSEERRLKLSEQYRRASQHVSRPVIRLGWGSTEGIRRLVSALWWRRTA